jgi:hypothetical protein
MKKSSAGSDIAGYIAGLPEDRRDEIAKLRALLKRRMPKGYEESLLYGAIGWAVPLKTLPDTYNGQPLCYAALAVRKGYMTLHLMAAYGDPAERKKLEEGFRKAGKRLDMGKSCIRFRSLDDLPLDVIGDSIARISPAKYVAAYQRTRSGTKIARRTSKRS